MTLSYLKLHKYNKKLAPNFCTESAIISYFNSIFSYINSNEIFFFATRFRSLITTYLRRFIKAEIFLYTKFLKVISLIYNTFHLLITRLQLNKKNRSLFFFRQNYFSKKIIKKALKKYPSIKSIYININIVPNNIFCNFSSISGSKTFRFKTAGILKIKVSKKRLFYGAQLILESFFKELNTWRKRYLVVNAISFINLKMPKYIIRYTLRKLLRTYPYVVNINYAIPFNGCKAKKRRRKKRLSYRNFK